VDGFTYKVGIIGCGRIASEFEDDPSREHPCTHAGAYFAVSQTKMECASDIDKSKLEKFSKRWGVHRLYTDYKEMLSREKLDIVSVCTSPETHSQITIDAAKSGVKAIFCEKPMATSTAEARKMVEICKKHGVQLTVNHYRRWDTNYKKIKGILAKKELGEIAKIAGCYTSGLFAVGTHMIDLLVYFCGEVDKVVGAKEETKGVHSLWYSENYSPADPPVNGILWFKNGVIGHLLASCKTQTPFFDIEIFATCGRIHISEWWVLKNLFEVYKFKGGKIPKLRLQKRMISRRTTTRLFAVEDIVSSLRENRPTLSSGEDALQTMMVIDALIKSSKTNTPIKVG